MDNSGVPQTGQLPLLGGRRYWIHRVEAQFLRPVAMRKCIGSRSKRGRTVRKVRRGDGVILATTLLIPREHLPSVRKIAFVAAGQVESSAEETRPVVGYDQHKLKHRLRAVKFFATPIFLEEAAALGLSILAGKTKLSDAMDFEYREISGGEFERILAARELSDRLPEYVETARGRGELPFSDKQLIKIFQLTREILRWAMPKQPQVEIKLFLHTVAGLLQGAGLPGDYESLYEEYRRLARETGFQHGPSRDPELQVELLDGTGQVRRLSYIHLR